ncbi:MAG TPA: peptidylprolyl isomerase [Phycisphaerales bacterium]|nr:peptidylprolyl isomerase [Phycisphaerales bacterium]
MFASPAPTDPPRRWSSTARLAVLAALGVILSAAPAQAAPPTAPARPAQTAPDRPAGEPAAPPKSDAPADPPAKEPAALGTVFAVLETSKGDILLELDGEKAPISVANFLVYLDEGLYDETVFHRVMDGFMIQGGGFNERLEPRPTKPAIKNEWTNGLRNERGTIAMARLPQPDSATSQFFINVRDNPALNGNAERGMPGYAVFGKVVAGMDAVDAIRVVPTEPRGMHQNVPKEPVKIVKARRVETEVAKKRIAAEQAERARQESQKEAEKSKEKESATEGTTDAPKGRYGS